MAGGFYGIVGCSSYPGYIKGILFGLHTTDKIFRWLTIFKNKDKG